MSETHIPVQRRLHQTSVVIPVKDDSRLAQCIASIDEEVEIVVACNGSSSEFSTWVRDIVGAHAVVVELASAGIGPAYNAGIDAANGRYILLLDSDCMFQPGALRELVGGLDDAPMAKGRVLFTANSWNTSLTARAREVLEDPLKTERVKAYSPPLVYDREIVSAMGGYHFNDKLCWREDRDFELRRRAASIPVSFRPDACVVHAAMTIRTDLRSVFKYGQAEALGRAMRVFPRERPWYRMGKTLTTAARIARVERSPGLIGYFLTRRFAFNAGRYSVLVAGAARADHDER